VKKVDKREEKETRMSYVRWKQKHYVKSEFEEGGPETALLFFCSPPKSLPRMRLHLLLREGSIAITA